jgi:hypothetical protein
MSSVINSSKFAFLALSLVSLEACRRAKPPEPAVATPTVSLSRAKAPLGSPIDITYRFEVAADAPAFAENERVFVGVVDADGELMWTDDHEPPVPTREWKPGQKLEYTRTVFIPIFPYIGEASIHMGLYSPTNGKRLPLSGADTGQRAYKVAKIQIQPQTENVFTVYKEGWHGPESPPNNTLVEWQWTKKEGVLGFKNPKKDSLLYLDLDNPSDTFPEGQHIQVLLGGQSLEEFVLPSGGQRLLRKVPLTANQLGTTEMLELRIAVDKTFVPALIPAANNKDPRELGARVFHIFIGPKA